MGFSFNLWEGSVNSILSEKEKSSKTCTVQIENNQMVLFMFWCEVCHWLQAATYQVKEYLKPHKWSYMDWWIYVKSSVWFEMEEKEILQILYLWKV